MLDVLKEKIDSTEGIEFAPFGKGISEEWIKKAEERLNFVFPETYKWWLINYMGGE
ncbi:TPA: SMI1/KNR4 family protein, partial [Streptococcus suis]|nr:SMI1/KNR4 family protein [Streptococcus suis]